MHIDCARQLALGLTGLALAAAALPPLSSSAATRPALPSASGGVAAGGAGAGFEPPGFPKKDEMSRCPLLDIAASLIGACTLRLHADGATCKRCSCGASLV
jgi:hypothetical protein